MRTANPGQRSAHGARALAGHYFTSEEIFSREQERIFARRWLYAGHLCELPEPGSFFVRDLGTESVIVLRGAGGEVRAFHNVCRHRGSRLCSEPSGRFAGAIRCPYHAWSYGLAGELKGAPGMEGTEGFDPSDCGLGAVATALLEGLVFLCLDPGAEPFEQAFAPLARRFRPWTIPELRSVHRTVYEVSANWKLLFENYSECYHCPAAHPALNRLTPFRDSTNDLEEGPFLGGPMTLATDGDSMSMDGRRCAPPLAGVEGEDLRRIYYYTVMPNLFLSLHPDYVLVHRSEPLGPAATRVTCDWLFHPSAVAAEGFDPSGAIEFWDMTNRQDWELCANSQLGVASRAYRPGPLNDLESQIAAFDREYLRELDGVAGSPGAYSTSSR